MAAVNTNPSRVTNPMWGFWLAFRKLEPTVLCGGFYSPKTGYHDSRAGNPKGNYSIISAIDRKGPSVKASAIDLTFPSAQRGDYRLIIKYSKRLLASGKDIHDERGNYLREYFGTINGRTVVGWDYQAVRMSKSEDLTHTWHLHLSFSRGHSESLKGMRAVLSILAGEPVKIWRAKEAALLIKPPPKPTIPPVVGKPPAKTVPPSKVVTTPPLVVLPPPPVVVVPPVVATEPPPFVVGAVAEELPQAAPPPIAPAPVPPPIAPEDIPSGFWASFLAWLRSPHS